MCPRFSLSSLSSLPLLRFRDRVTTQVTSLADNLARYEYNFRAKIRAAEAIAKEAVR